MTDLVGRPVPSSLATATGETLVELLERAARRTPDRDALVTRRRVTVEHWTYRQLAARIDTAAHAFVELGVEPGDRVLLWSANDPHLVAALAGAWRIGAVPVPLDVRMAPDTIARIARSADPVLAVVGTGLAADGLGLPASRIVPLDLGAAAVDRSRLALPGPPRPEDLAEILYTSGTTGDPKGVMLSHGAIVSSARSVVAVTHGRAERALAIIPFSHMYGQIVPLLAGAITGSTLVLPSSMTPGELVGAMVEGRVTAITQVPAIAQVLADRIRREVERLGETARLAASIRRLSRLPFRVRRRLLRRVLAPFGGQLRLFSVGGARMDAALQAFWEGLGVRVLVGYGLTECPAISGQNWSSRHAGTVGRPMVGVRVRLAADGEILTTGPNVASGYWGRPDLDEVIRDGWVHTGDVGAVDSATGDLVVLGRTRDRIALPTGLKVYPEDVEAALASEAAVAASAVVEVDGRIVAALVAAAGASDGELADAVRRANTRLAPHQRVARFRRYPEPDLPRTHTLKVRRAAVRERLVLMLDEGSSGTNA
jgi:long-chain acyl-CoA synthetase